MYSLDGAIRLKRQALLKIQKKKYPEAVKLLGEAIALCPPCENDLMAQITYLRAKIHHIQVGHCNCNNIIILALRINMVLFAIETKLLGNWHNEVIQDIIINMPIPIIGL